MRQDAAGLQSGLAGAEIVTCNESKGNFCMAATCLRKPYTRSPWHSIAGSPIQSGMHHNIVASCLMLLEIVDMFKRTPCTPVAL